MKRPPFLRRPGKLILTSLLLAVTAGAAMLFALQVWLDAATLTQSMDAYAYVGTLAYETNQPVSADIQTAMDLAFLDEAVVEQIKGSGHVTSVDIRTSKAGRGYRDDPRPNAHHRTTESALFCRGHGDLQAGFHGCR